MRAAVLTVVAVLSAATAAATANEKRPWAVVTGASSGIGRAIALEAALRGFSVVVAARRKRALSSLVVEIRACGVQAMPVVVDLASTAGPAKLHRATARLGTSIELVVANAGFALAGDVVDADSRSIEQLAAVNMASVALLCRFYGANLAASGKGAILLTSSLTALAPLPRAALYGASRAFVHNLADGLATELAPRNVRVRCLLPGATDTGFAFTSGIETSLAFTGPLFRPLGIVTTAAQVATAALDSVDERPWAALRQPSWAANCDVYVSFLQHAYAFAARALMPRSLASAFAADFFGAASPLASASALLGSLPVLLPGALCLVAAMPLTLLQGIQASLLGWVLGWPTPLLALLLVLVLAVFLYYVLFNAWLSSMYGR